MTYTDEAGKGAEMKVVKVSAGRTGEEQEIHISVRGLVEFILRHGDIDNRHQVSPDNAMQEGGRIHRMIQRRMGAEYQAEVSLKYTCHTEDYVLIVEGRADGVIHRDGRVIIDEIKGTYRELARMKEHSVLNIAQAKCYAYMYGLEQELQNVSVRMTYCHMPTEELRYFYEDYSMEELGGWFSGLLEGPRPPPGWERRSPQFIHPYRPWDRAWGRSCFI